MKKIFLMMVIVLLSSACKNMKGSLESVEKFSLNSRRGTVTFEPGTYSAELKIRSKKKMVLETKVNGSKKKFNFTIPEGTIISRDGGMVRLTAEEISQPVDLSVEVRKDNIKGEVTKTVQACELRVCVRRADGSCSPNRRWIYGELKLEYWDVTEVTAVDMTVLSAEDQKVVATFKGQKKEDKERKFAVTPCKATK